MPAARSIAEQYSAGLATLIAGSRESVLLDAHELGRRAVAEGVGVLDLVNLHHLALRGIAAGSDGAADAKWLDAAAAFLAELLSPFEMMLRGYREANSELVATIRALQEAKVEAESANRELEAFSYSVAHDLRAPLRSLDGFSQIVLEDYAEKLDADGRHYLQYIRDSAQQMALLIDDLLTLSRVTRAEFQRQPVDLTSIARTIAAKLRAREPERRVEIAIAEGLAGEGDPRLMAIALENLIGNAWKYSGKREAARIEVGSVRLDGNVAYFVRDNGAGFDMAYADKLFGVFQRLHTAEEFEGTGIGLATVQRIILRHGGHIWAQGEVGRGATFFFKLAGGRPRSVWPGGDA
jgi:light-regulated signal transduction histidine kinase (bacteriophytochrome)